MTYEYFIKRKPTEVNLKLQRPVIWEPCDLSLRISKNFKCAKKTAIKIFNEFVKCGSSGYIYSLCQDKGCGFSEIKRLCGGRCVDLLEAIEVMKTNDSYRI